MSFESGVRRDNDDDFEGEDAGQKLKDRDRRGAQDSAEELAEALEQAGRLMDAGVVRALAGHCADLVERVQALGEQLEELRTVRPKKKRQTVKTSGGKERANASGTINKPGPDYGPNYKPLGIAPPKAFTQSLKGGHKHAFDADGACTRWDEVTKRVCGARRQRAARKPKQTTIPGVDGAKDSASAGEGRA